MMKNWKNPWAIMLITSVVTACGMLGLYRTACAQQQRGNPLPFSNSVEQREEMVRELKEIKELLREQNTLLRTLVTHASNTATKENATPANR